MSLCERDDVKTAEGPKVNGGRVPACTALGDFSGGELTMSTEARPTLSAVWTQSTSLAQQKLVDMFANVAGVCAVFCIPFSQFFRADLDETLSESIVFRKFIELSRTLKLLQFAEKSWKLTPSEKKRTSFWGW